MERVAAAVRTAVADIDALLALPFPDESEEAVAAVVDSLSGNGHAAAASAAARICGLEAAVYNDEEGEALPTDGAASPLPGFRAEAFSPPAVPPLSLPLSHTTGGFGSSATTAAPARPSDGLRTLALREAALVRGGSTWSTPASKAEAARRDGAAVAEALEELREEYREFCRLARAPVKGKPRLSVLASRSEAELAKGAARKPVVAQVLRAERCLVALLLERAMRKVIERISEVGDDDAEVGMELRARISIAERDAALMRDELVRKRRAHAREFSLLSASVAAARAEAAAMEDHSTSTLARIETLATADEKARTAAHAEQHVSLLASLEAAQGALAQAKKAAADAEAAARKRVERFSGEVETTINEMDTSLLALSANIDKLRSEAARDAALIAQFTAYYAKVDEEIARTKAEEAVYYQKRVLKATEVAMAGATAVVKMQRWWKQVQVKKAEAAAEAKRAAKKAAAAAKKKAGKK